MQPLHEMLRSGADAALLRRMVTPARFPLGAIAVVSSVVFAGCTSATTLGVSPETVLSTVIANLPRSTESYPGPSRAPSTSRRIPDSPAPSSAAEHVLRFGSAYIGVPYVWGGNTPREGFDCSGFTKYVFAQSGIALPRTSREQVHAGYAVAPDFRALRPGDLMMFAEPGQAISHVAIYAGNGRILHSSSSNGGVGYTDLNAGGEWFYRYFVAARRVF
jgi:cell wall-associated NlpC family hydrolase